MTPRFDFKPQLAELTSDVFQPGMPLSNYLSEAKDVAAFSRSRWEPQKLDDGRTIPGLVSVAPMLSATVGDEIDVLVDQVYAAHAKYEKLTGPASAEALLERGHFVLGEITAALEFLFDDGVQDEKDQQLVQVKNAHENDGQIDLLAHALYDFADLARPYRSQLDGLGDFDAKLIDEAVVLHQQLLALPPTPRTPTDEQKHTLALRNRLLQLVHQRVQRVRKAAQFVFRQHPDIARQASSSYLRRHRAEARRRAMKTVEETKVA